MVDQIDIGKPASAFGNNQVTVSAWHNLVVLHLQQPQEYLPFSATGAVDTGTRMLAFALSADSEVAKLVLNAAMFLIDHVYDQRADLKPASGAVKHELIERHRSKLTNRLEVLLNSQREMKTKSNHKLAVDIVGIMLKEVFS